MALAEDITLTLIAPGSPEYEQARELRFETLYEPLGMSRETLEADEESEPTLHVSAIRSGAVVGYGRAIFEGGRARIRQVAVAPELQKTGIGTAIVLELLDRASRQGVTRAVVPARISAVAFYLRLGFETVGEEFLSDRTGTPHIMMERALVPAPGIR